ncbi:medium-chain acyl-CoA ligase ACSF2, mitochondrial-like [Amphiura filiformis]|uniref:medium-chain acyl-CoA ligase ACSF2, mitochondrial-like n=1 Tax=Amphiura filiformis TaxID=82378 RepID=UPI003B21D101
MEVGNAVEKSDFLEACELVDLDDPLGVFFTSGSTGFPKGVTHAHRLCDIFSTFLDSLSTDAEGNEIPWMSRYALIMSFGGIGAQTGALLPVFTKATTIIVGPVYDAKMLARVMHDEKITGTTMLIHHLNDILNLSDIKDHDLSSLELCFTGGSIIPRSLRDRVAKIAKHILLGYGGSEGFAASQTPRDSIEVLEGAAYSLTSGQELKIIGPDEQILPINTPGEICFRGRNLFMYYWGEDEKTKASKRPNGWYHTGDIGTLDENGYLRIVGRKAERIIKEGINIAPGDLEKVLDQHPAVNNVMVVGVPDERTSEEVCACVRLHPSTKVTADELREFCRGKVSDFLVPKYLLFMEAAFPTTETGKFHRNQIAAQAKSELGL